MTAWRPSNPDGIYDGTPEGESPAYWDLGGHVNESGDITVTDESASPAPKRHVGRRYGSKTTDGDSSLDPNWNVTQYHYTPAQAIDRRVRAHLGAEEVRAAHRAALARAAIRNQRVTHATPEQLAKQHSDAADGWPEEDDDTTLFDLLEGPRWAWKQPHER